MKSWKKDFLQDYVCGFITGLGVAGLIALIYLRAVFELGFIGPGHADYGWVTFVTGTKYFTSSWCESMFGYATTLLVVAIFAIFVGIILSYAILRDRKSAKKPEIIPT